MPRVASVQAVAPFHPGPAMENVTQDGPANAGGLAKPCGIARRGAAVSTFGLVRVPIPVVAKRKGGM